MQTLIKLYFLTFISAMAVDGVWLTVVAKPFYTKHLGFLMTSTPNLFAALLFYVINTVGVLVLIVLPALAQDSLAKALGWGALYGLCVYAAYDLTNLATIKNWPLMVTVVDWLWGVAICTFTAFLGFKIGKGLGL